MLHHRCVEIFTSESNLKLVKKTIPAIPGVRQVSKPVADILKVRWESTNGVFRLLWVDDSTIQFLKRKNYIIHKHDPMVICAGTDLSPGSLIFLGQAGFQKFYNTTSEVDLLKRELLDWLEHSGDQEPNGETQTFNIEIIGDCPAIRYLEKMIQTVASKEKIIVLLRGETGTGKGLVASKIHRISSRKEFPYVEINCTAIPDTLIESELFGHEKGAFTDAHRSRKGIFELAQSGTLFLDEIGYLKPDIQVKLLKVLEERKIRRLGGEREIPVDCRIIAGTSVDLESAIDKGKFREDLYYRLNVFPLWLPPLRERGNDIVLLAEHFREIYSKEHQITPMAFTTAAVMYLKSYTWPGNIRELKHAVERAVILSDGKIETEHLQLPVGLSRNIQIPKGDAVLIEIPPEGKSLQEIELEIVRRVLEMTSNNRSEAARRLKISRSRLLRKISGQ